MVDPTSIQGGFITPAMAAKAINSASKIAMANDKTAQLGEELKEAGVNAAKSLAKGVGISDAMADAIIDTVSGIAAENASNRDSGGSANINVNMSNDNTSSISSGSISYDSIPVKTELSTNLAPIGYGALYQVNTTSPFWSGLHLTRVSLGFPNSPSSALYTYFNNVLQVEFVNAVQGAVGFQVNTAVLTTANLISAFNAVIAALQTFIFYDSVLTYCNNPSNRNDGMFALRNYCSADGINNLYNLKRILQGTPIPPNLLTLCYWLGQTYANGDFGGTSLIKIVPVDFLTNSMSTNISTAMSNLSAANATFTQVSRACPKWLNNTISSSNSEPLFDRQFQTLFSNLPWVTTTAVGGATVSNWPNVTGTNTDVAYTSWTNNVDGIIFGLSYIANGNVAPLNTLMKPDGIAATTGLPSNRISYAGNNTWIAPESNGYYDSQRAETFKVINFFNQSSAITNSVSYAGTEPVFGINAGTTLQAMYRSMDYLLNISSIGSIKDSRMYNNKAGSDVYKSNNKPRGNKFGKRK